MKKLLALLPLFALAPALLFGQMSIPFPGPGQVPAAAGNTIGFVQKKSSTNTCPTDNADCSVTVTAIGTTKHFGVIMAGMTANYTLSSVTGGGGTWIVDTGCHGYFVAAGVDASCAYNLLFDTASTTVTVTWTTSSPVAPGFVFREFSYTGTSVSRNTSDKRAQASAVNPIPGVTLNLGGFNSVVVQSQVYDTALSVDAPYTDFTIFMPGSHGADGYLMNTTSGTAPNWNFTGTDYAQLSAIAIKAD